MKYFFIVAILFVVVTQQYANGEGVSYKRWGKTSCPTGAELVYEGFVAGGWMKTEGSGANYLCLPLEDPDYVNSEVISRPSYIYSTQYDTDNQVFGERTQASDAPCVVCYVSTRSTELMVPARVNCPAGWVKEYSGYLMSTEPSNLINTDYICVDEYAEVLNGSADDQVGCVLNFVAAFCAYSHLSCPPYEDQHPITCVVCTR